MPWRPPARLIIPWRYFVTGYPILPPRDNASFLHHATEDYRHKPIPKLSRARWERVARRNAACTVPCLLATASPWITLWPAGAWLAFGAAACSAWLVKRGIREIRAHNPWRMVRDRKVRREFIDPAAEVLARILGRGYIRSRDRRTIELPHGWGTGDAIGDGAPRVARVWLPSGVALDAGVKRRVTENVGARLGIPHPVGQWNEMGAAPFVDISGAPTAPREVLWTSLLPAIARCAEDEVVLGRESGNRLVTLSASEDSPHFAMSGSSGTGKSVTGKVFLAQRLHRGDGVIILDPKKWSHWRWAGDGKLPTDRCIYAYKTEDLHDAWLSIAAESDRRIDLDEDELARQRRVWITVEEINAATKRLTRYWTSERKRRMAIAKGLLVQAKELMGEGLTLEEAADAVGLDLRELDLPATSPAVVAMQESVGMGRELRMHVVVMAQRLSASVFGGNGGDIRESFQGGRLIARWDRKLWKMLVDTLAYVACPTGPRGIWGLARGEDFTVFRVPFLSDPDATAYALSGAPAPGPVLGPCEGMAVVDVAEGQPAITRGITLADAVHILPGQDGPRALSLDGLRKAAQRTGFPAPLDREYGRTEARLYDPDGLIEWRRSAL